MKRFVDWAVSEDARMERLEAAQSKLELRLDEWAMANGGSSGDVRARRKIEAALDFVRHQLWLMV